MFFWGIFMYGFSFSKFTNVNDTTFWLKHQGWCVCDIFEVHWPSYAIVSDGCQPSVQRCNVSLKSNWVRGYVEEKKSWEGKRGNIWSAEENKSGTRKGRMNWNRKINGVGLQPTYRVNMEKSIINVKKIYGGILQLFFPCPPSLDRYENEFLLFRWWAFLPADGWQYGYRYFKL